jgi:ABC-type Zn uptake system ZnuABC Zn-binding protein ZnuA
MSGEHPLVTKKPGNLVAAAKRPGLIGALLGMLALDWAALDDLTTDAGSSWFLEGMILVVSIPVIAVLVRNIWGKGENEE